MQTVRIFRQASVHGLGKAKKALDDQKWMLNFTTYRGFAPLNLLLPVNAPFGHSLDAMVTAIDPILYRRQMRRIFHLFPFLYADIP
jgi:hypothetical protein